jgi:hypothetical protein
VTSASSRLSPGRRAEVVKHGRIPTPTTSPVGLAQTTARCGRVRSCRRRWPWAR